MFGLHCWMLTDRSLLAPLFPTARYVRLLLELVCQERGAGRDVPCLACALGAPHEELPVASASGGIYQLPPLPLQWDAAAVARAVVEDELGASGGADGEKQRLQPWHLEVLAAAAGGEKTGVAAAAARALAGAEGKDGGEGKAADGGGADEEEAWLGVFNGVYEYLMLSLAHEDCCALAVRPVEL